MIQGRFTHLPGNAQLPSLLQFEGEFENRDPFETGVRYDLSWSLADGGAFGGSEYIDFTHLPASGRLTVAFTKWIWFTPQTMRLLIEGGGPDDHFRFVGELRVRQIAPSTMANCLPPTDIIGWWPGDLVTNDVIGGRHAVLRGGAGFGAGRVLEAF